jgi:ketosteroid isomerase-like protein
MGEAGLAWDRRAMHHDSRRITMTKHAEATIRAFYDAVDRRDIPTAFGVLDPDVEWVAPASLPYGGTYRGVDAVANEYFGGFLRHVDDDFALRAEEITGAADTVVVRGRLSGHGRVSGRPFEVRQVGLWTVRGGRVVQFEYSLDTAALLAAVEAEPVLERSAS